MSVKCEVCLINNAEVKDYRLRQGVYAKYYVCRNCFMLNDEDFFKLKYAKGDKRTVTMKITGRDWKEYLIKEP